jgi:hypothetical protein
MRVAMLAISTPHFRNLVRASALYDVIVTAGFATPWSFQLVQQQLSTVNQALGGSALPEFSVFHVLIACLLGSIVLVWSVLRLRDPQPRFGRYDAAARFLFATWMAWALHATGAPVLWLFVLPEFSWGVAQCLPLRE